MNAAIAHTVIVDETILQKWLEKLQQSDGFALYLQTDEATSTEKELLGIAFCTTTGESAYLPFAEIEKQTQKQTWLDFSIGEIASNLAQQATSATLPREQTLAKLSPLLSAEMPIKCGIAIKSNRHLLARHGIELCSSVHDIQLQSYILNSTYNCDDLPALAHMWLQESIMDRKTLLGSGRQQRTITEVPLGEMVNFAADNAALIMRLQQLLYPQITQSEKLNALYHDIELPLLKVLTAMEGHGVMIDLDILQTHSEELRKNITEIEQKIYQLAGEEFQIASPLQLRHILYEKLKLDTERKTSTGKRSTSESALQELAITDELPALILQHRALNKLRSTYTDTLPQQVNTVSKKIHTHYHQTVTVTGRLSSSHPNLQNIPVRTSEGRRIREAFICPAGYSLLSADYSQIELRIMAHIAEDESLIAAFIAGVDIHKKTAMEVFTLAEDAITAEQRRAAKAINFGLIYGISAVGLARQLQLPQEQAQEYIDLYFGRYPKVREYMNRLRAQVHSHTYVESLFGRRMFFPLIQSKKPAERQHAERAAINAPIQGTAADIIKRAMIAIHRQLISDAIDARMIMQVHDELVFEVSEQHTETLRQCVSRIMSTAATLKVPLIVDIGIGKNWNEAH